MDLFNLLVGTALLLVGGWLVWRAVDTMRQSRRARGWQPHAATVLASGMSTIGLARPFPGDGVIRQANLRYTWQLDGQHHEGSRVRFTIWRLGGQSLAAVQNDLANTQSGAVITIRVDPDDPRNAVIHPEFDQVAVLTSIMLGGLFAGYGLWLVVTGL